jgi:hypothetical protein
MSFLKKAPKKEVCEKCGLKATGKKQQCKTCRGQYYDPKTVDEDVKQRRKRNLLKMKNDKERLSRINLWKRKDLKDATNMSQKSSQTSSQRPSRKTRQKSRTPTSETAKNIAELRVHEVGLKKLKNSAEIMKKANTNLLRAYQKKKNNNEPLTDKELTYAKKQRKNYNKLLEKRKKQADKVMKLQNKVTNATLAKQEVESKELDTESNDHQEKTDKISNMLGNVSELTTSDKELLDELELEAELEELGDSLGGRKTKRKTKRKRRRKTKRKNKRKTKRRRKRKRKTRKK